MDHYEHSHSKGNSRLWFSIAIVVILTAVAILMVPDEKPEKVEAIPRLARVSPSLAQPVTGKNPGAETGSGPAAIGEQVPVGGAEMPTKESKGPEGSVARAFLSSAEGAGIGPAELVAKAREFQRQGLAGDAWLLYFKAAREGNASAAMALAEQADPDFFDPGSSALSAPDPVQAHKWYRIAEKAGSDEATRRLEQLFLYLQRAEANGDERAALLLQEWKGK